MKCLTKLQTYSELVKSRTNEHFLLFTLQERSKSSSQISEDLFISYDMAHDLWCSKQLLVSFSSNKEKDEMFNKVKHVKYLHVDIFNSFGEIINGN